MLHTSNMGIKKLGFLLLTLYISMANAIEVEVTGTKNWIWFKDGQPSGEQPIQKPMTQGTETGDKVSLAGNQYYTSNSNFISSIVLNGENQIAVIQTNKKFTIGTLTLKGDTSMAVAGSYETANCANDLQCAVFDVENLLLDSKSGKEILLRRVSAQNTTIIGDGTINIGNKGTGTAENNTNLGNVVVSNGASATMKSDTTATTKANSIKIEDGAKLTFGNDIQGEMDIGTLEVAKGGTLEAKESNKDKLKVETLDVKSGATITAESDKMTVSNVIAEAGVSGLDKILGVTTKLTLTAIKSGTIAEFLSDTSTNTNLGTTIPSSYKEGATIKHNVVDSGVFKYSGDFVQVVAKGNDGNYTANAHTTNLSVTPSDRLQATLDNKYLAHHILLNNTMAISNKLFLFDSFKSNNEIQKEARTKQVKNANMQNTEYNENKAENHVDLWVDYEYNNISEYGKELNADTHSVQLGVGFLQTNFIKVGGFFRYTYLGADNNSIDNTYSAHAYNTGLYGVANIWTNGYFRGQFSYTGINLKGNYTLRNDMADTNIGGVLKDNFHYLATSVGVAQEGIIGNIFWGSIALDITHIVPLIEESDFVKYNFSKNSITLATLSGMAGIKIYDSMIYARGQVGYVISSKDMEIDLSQRARSDFYAGGTATTNGQWQSNFGIINDYKYNMIVGDIGIGGAYNFTKSFKGSIYLGAGFYSESKPNFKIGMGLNYLF